MSDSQDEIVPAAIQQSAHNEHPHYEGAGSTVTVEQLLDYLVAAKRSLSATDHVWRANHIVQSAREALVEHVELKARSAFVRDGISGQVKILASVKNGVERRGEKGRTEFEVLQILFHSEPLPTLSKVQLFSDRGIRPLYATWTTRMRVCKRRLIHSSRP